MKERRNITPYMFSADMAVNASLSLAKIHKRIFIVDPNYKPWSYYQARLRNKRAARQRPGIVR